MLNEILEPKQSTTVLLETMAGKGSEVGSCFEELREIIDRVELKKSWEFVWILVMYMMQDTTLQRIWTEF